MTRVDPLAPAKSDNMFIPKQNLHSNKEIHTETCEQEKYSNDMVFAIRGLEVFVRKCVAEFQGL